MAWRRLCCRSVLNGTTLTLSTYVLHVVLGMFYIKNREYSKGYPHDIFGYFFILSCPQYVPFHAETLVRAWRCTHLYIISSEVCIFVANHDMCTIYIDIDISLICHVIMCVCVCVFVSASHVCIGLLFASWEKWRALFVNLILLFVTECMYSWADVLCALQTLNTCMRGCLLWRLIWHLCVLRVTHICVLGVTHV